ncbi:hypothetical protein Hanom_Chr12g01158451 [Helianthus anomalus]
MGARKDLSVSFSHFTQEEVEAFCMEWGIGLKFNSVAPGCDKSVDHALLGRLLYTIAISSSPIFVIRSQPLY